MHARQTVIIICYRQIISPMLFHQCTVHIVNSVFNTIIGVLAKLPTLHLCVLLNITLLAVGCSRN